MSEPFTITYRWCEGTVPPPDYYEFAIQIGPENEGQIRFSPDYPGDDTPRWVENFEVEAQARQTLFELGRAALGYPAPEVDESAPVGDSLAWIIIEQGAHTHKLSNLPELEEIYTIMRALVPKRMWDSLDKRRAAYIRNSPKEQQ